MDGDIVNTWGDVFTVVVVHYHLPCLCCFFFASILTPPSPVPPLITIYIRWNDIWELWDACLSAKRRSSDDNNVGMCALPLIKRRTVKLFYIVKYSWVPSFVFSIFSDLEVYGGHLAFCLVGCCNVRNCLTLWIDNIPTTTYLLCIYAHWICLEMPFHRIAPPVHATSGKNVKPIIRTPIWQILFSAIHSSPHCVGEWMASRI